MSLWLDRLTYFVFKLSFFLLIYQSYCKYFLWIFTEFISVFYCFCFLKLHIFLMNDLLSFVTFSCSSNFFFLYFLAFYFNFYFFCFVWLCLGIFFVFVLSLWVGILCSCIIQVGLDLTFSLRIILTYWYIFLSSFSECLDCGHVLAYQPLTFC